MRALLVRPWIHDFSAYDLWIQPLGLLYLAGVLAQNGFDLDYVDCLEKRFEHKPDGRAKFAKKIIPTPEPLKGILRHYRRFGISPDEFHERLKGLQNPDVILVTSGMTYWYPGIQETIRNLREAYPETKILLGGIYATLMLHHARLHAGADVVVAGEFENQIVDFLNNLQRAAVPGRQAGAEARSPKFSLHDYPWPAWHLTGEKRYRVLMTSRGCPYRCTFCASDVLNDQKFQQRNVDNVLAELEKYYFEDHIEHFVFYDDALLIHHKKHLQPLLEKVIARGIQAKFHTPNGLNAREIDGRLAELMYTSGFKTIRLSLESVNPDIQKVQANNKVTNQLFENAINNLYRAGYVAGDVECYLIQGLPDQKMEDVLNSLEFAAGLGVIARLATFSPIPGTPEAEVARKKIGDHFLVEPLLQNHSYFPLKNTRMTEQDLQYIKDLCNSNNERIRARGIAS
ncbi:B12-binding domain-containing radical SAM protein [bacterium]|nr:B12-binding domain-containing radical SAM protein [bacterium]